MAIQCTFAIDGSFKLTKHGLVIYGDILDGVLRKEDLFLFRSEEQEFKLRIREINFLDRIGEERISKVGLTFYYYDDQQKEKLKTLQVGRQTAKTIGV